MSFLDCDVVVVGAGSAGAVVANRLSASGSCNVVLLEAGPDYSAAITPQLLASLDPLALLDDEGLMQTYMYPDLSAARSSAQAAAPYRRGRGVGGSSAINGLFAVRPTVADMEEWAAAGCEGWSFDQTLPFLNRLESDCDFGDRAYHGDDGPLPVVRPGTTAFSPLDHAFRDGCLAQGHDWTPDHNRPGATGVSPYAYNGRDSRRISTNDAYLEPARSRPNLRVLGETVVDRVLFEGRRALGVSAISAGSAIEVRAADVVLCAGAIHTPAVLLRSGVGPADDLAELGIRVREDLPVGHGLQEHPAMAVLIQLGESARSEPGGRHAACCLRFDTADGGEPDGGMISATATSDPTVGAVIGWVNRVESTGRVRLADTNPELDPRVDLGMLATDEDRRRMRRVVEELASITAEDSFRQVGDSLGLLTSTVDNSLLPVRDALSDPEFDHLLLDAVFDVSHATSTCRMGASSDPTTVVAPTGAVHGLDNLYVADASVLPWVPRANTHLSAVLVGERVADVLLELGGS